MNNNMEDTITINPKQIVKEIIARKNEPDFDKTLETIINEVIRKTTLRTFESNLKIMETGNLYQRRI